ncbi:ATP-binding protein [Sedimentisphaera salicampi]|uniref:ATP-binding protein n=1 Tax=Sedimentisphaera salicampi TaxID=1941349 RepID=UPI000B9AFC42|nr:ATP-binding protein [Sedimentisphaera salicampi]OXU14911.1 ferredoxin [Sedimentisphaera salicampi]
MRLAVASGKGGTGKTTLSVSLARAYEGPSVYLDCDVEEPNGNIFLKPDIINYVSVKTPVPEVDKDRCDGCGKCAEFCNFNAIAIAGGKPIVFPELCHGCGGCEMVCPAKAITEVGRKAGSIAVGETGTISTAEGLLDIGNAMAPPVIREVKKYIREDALNIIDCPPGNSCPMITAVKDVDFVILVTEPTPFGLNDLILAVETVRELEIPFGVVINRSDSGDGRVVKYCRNEGINLLLEIPESRELAEAYSKGADMVDSVPGLEEKLKGLISEIEQTAAEVSK